MSAATETPDTPRRHIETLARRAASFPDWGSDIEDEVALVSTIADRAAMERVFSELVLAYRRREPSKAKKALDQLTRRSW